MADNGNLTGKQKRAIACLLTEPTTLAAAEKAGVGYRTLNRWLTDPDFKAALREAESASLDAATRRLIGLESLATAALREILESHKVAAGVKVRAARSVLDYLLKLRELRNVEDRLTEIEELVRETRNLKRQT